MVFLVLSYTILAIATLIHSFNFNISQEMENYKEETFC